MKLNVKALALTLSILWGAGMFIIILANLIWPPYGDACLRVLESGYPGFTAGNGLQSLITGTLYGALDGGIGGYILGWLYNKLAGKIA